MTKTFTLLLSFSALLCNAQQLKQRRVADLKLKLAAKNNVALIKDKLQAASATQNTAPAQKSTAVVNSFTAFSTSSNIYGVISNASKPLQYNTYVNGVSFIQRRSDSYNAVPNNNTGAIIAMISSNWGSLWDSTCLYTSASDFGRYPQGAIYSAPGNTNIANAYVVGSGPTTDGAAWTGNWFASKQLAAPGSTVFNNVASAVPGAQQFFSTSGPQGPTVFSNDFAQYGFASTADGRVRSLGLLTSDPDASPIDVRGAVIQSGSFNAGVFSWATDSLIPPVVLNGDDLLQMSANPIMAWNQSGTTGYVVFIGSRNGQTLSNKGWQPIVYKTINSGLAWQLLPGIDFNNSAFQQVKDRLDAVGGNPSLKIPLFNTFEGIDCTVDSDGKLHIAAAIASSASQHTDSLSYTNEYDTEGYVWPHTPGKMPYLYDFTGDGNSAWTFMTIDSITSEAPNSVATYPGFADNPWDDDQGKVTSDSRIQLSRTPDGKYIMYTWAESDPLLTNGGRFWNTIPNVKARMWSNNPAFPATLSTTEINVTRPASGFNPNVASKAMFHFTSPTSGSATVTGAASSPTVQVKMPVTVTNSFPYIQGASNTHYFTGDPLGFVFVAPNGINEIKKDAVDVSLYPNPAAANCTVEFNLAQPATVTILVMNCLGQLVQENTMPAVIGKNNAALDLSTVKSGIYFVTIKSGNLSATKKLVVE